MSNDAKTRKDEFTEWFCKQHAPRSATPQQRENTARLYILHLDALNDEYPGDDQYLAKTIGAPWPGLIQCLTGIKPTVGVFEVANKDEFEKYYEAALHLIDKKELSQYSCPKAVFDRIKNSVPKRTATATALRQYRKYLGSLENLVDGGSGSVDSATKHPEPPKGQDNKPLPRNLIYFGAPGTGKSHQLKDKVEGRFVDGDEKRYERVTFYPTYSYAQFVGCYKPVMNGSDIAYKFVPGPFLRVLVNALKPGEDGKIKDWCLVIEEINRANAAAVFGDVFQLLDRGGKWSDGDDESIKPFFGDGAASEYDVAASEDIKRYLKEELAKCESARKFLKVVPGKDENGNNIWKECRLRIPSNMYIWATMNSADQGVFPMDTAFKRRWEFEYVGINDEVTNELQTWTIGENGFLWNKVRTFLNQRLTDNRVNEDKLMGPWFVKPENGIVVSENQFKSKVLMYLWEDAARMCRRKFFGESINTYSDLKDQWPDVFGSPEGWGETKKSWKRSNQEENQEDKKPSEPRTQSPEDGTEAVRT